MIRFILHVVVCLIPLVLILSPTMAEATVPVAGQLLAQRDCPLYQSIKKGTNPDGARLVPGQSYPVLGRNREVDASHFRIRAEGATPAERWVEVGCGKLVPDPTRGASPTAVPVEKDVPAGTSERRSASAQSAADEPSPPGRFVLSVSWPPAFCEQRSRRPECRSTRSRSRASFALHGLWPQPRDAVFCDISRDRREIAERGPWSGLPVLDLEDSTRRRLETVMPGTMSYLQRYQWVKHGSCYGTDSDTYYRHSIALVDQLNATAVRDLFTDNIGRHLSARNVRDAFDRSFGRGAGARVRLRCDDGMISELRIGLRGRVSESASLAGLIKAAEGRSAGCRGGRVDAPGIGR